MAEDNKSPEVEIDTDGVNEETINVDAPEVSNEAFEKKEDVVKLLPAKVPTSPVKYPVVTLVVSVTLSSAVNVIKSI